MQNELSTVDSGKTSKSDFMLEHPALAAGTLTGTVYRKAMAIQTFLVDEKGNYAFSPIGQVSDIMALSGTLNLKSGKAVLVWNTAPGDNHVLVSYGYFTPKESESK